MSRHVKLFLLFLSTILISSYAAKRLHNHIDKDARKHFSTVETYLIMPQDNIGADKNDNIYRKKFTYLKRLPINGNKKENVQILAQDNSEILKQALSESAQHIAEQIYADITLDDSADKKG